MQVTKYWQQLVPLHMLKGRPTQDTIYTYVPSSQRSARLNGLKGQCRRNSRHSQLLPRNARQLGVLAAYIHAMDGSGAMPQHQRKIRNSIATSKIQELRLTQVKPISNPLVYNVSCIAKVCTKPLVGDM